MTRAQPPLQRQNGAITLMVAIGLVILASLASFYSARSVLMDQLASHNHARASQARLAADAALASAQAALPSTDPEVNALFNTLSTCPAGVNGPQWQCTRLNPAKHPAIPQAQLSATAVRDLLQSPHVLTLHASASISGQNSQAKVRESVFVPTVAAAPVLPAQAALVLNGCVTEATGASLRVCPLVSKGEACASSAKGPAVLTHFVVDSNRNGIISTAEKNACLALSAISLPGGGSKNGPAVAVPRSPCSRAAWQSVLGDITDAQLQAWSTAQERNGLTAQTTPPRSIYWIDSPAVWQQSVGTADTPALLVFSATACAQRCPRIGTGVRIYGSVLIDSGCNDEKMRDWQAGTIEGQLVVESGLPEWRTGTLLARPDGRNAYILNWPEGMDTTRMQRVNGSWSEGTP
jgi:Tfp pilus assembly protein PilX